jgi:hypothetical protein
MVFLLCKRGGEAGSRSIYSLQPGDTKNFIADYDWKRPSPAFLLTAPRPGALRRSREPRGQEPQGWEEKDQEERDSQYPIQPFLRIVDPIKQQDGKEEGLDENLSLSQQTKFLLDLLFPCTQ